MNKKTVRDLGADQLRGKRALVRVDFGRRDDTEAGVNIKGGINFRTTGSVVPFFQGEYRAGDYDDVSIGGGIRFLVD